MDLDVFLSTVPVSSLQFEWSGSRKAGQTLALGSELSYYVMRTIFRSMYFTLYLQYLITRLIILIQL